MHGGRLKFEQLVPALGERRELLEQLEMQLEENPAERAPCVVALALPTTGRTNSDFAAPSRTAGGSGRGTKGCLIGEHVESRSGRFSPILYAGRGWNPAEALRFNADADRFWRCYRAYSDSHWSSFEIRREIATSSEYWRQSGYEFSGTRGCVRCPELRHRVSPEQAADYSAPFAFAAGRLVAGGCPGAEAAELWVQYGDRPRSMAISARRACVVASIPRGGTEPCRWNTNVLSCWIARARERRCRWRASEPSTIFATGYSAAMFGVNSSGKPL